MVWIKRKNLCLIVLKKVCNKENKRERVNQEDYKVYGGFDRDTKKRIEDINKRREEK